MRGSYADGSVAYGHARLRHAIGCHSAQRPPDVILDHGLSAKLCLWINNLIPYSSFIVRLWYGPFIPPGGGGRGRGGGGRGGRGGGRGGGPGPGGGLRSRRTSAGNVTMAVT